MVIRVLNVAEKPSVAKAVASILSHGSFRTREGKSVYNKIFEFKLTVGNQECEMRMTSVTGHLMELEFAPEFKKWQACNPSELYEAPVHKHVPRDKLPLKLTLEQEARSCQWLVLWLDCDREGENIAFEVMEICKASNSRLNIFRAHFSSLTDREIHQAMQSLGRPNERFSDAVDARQEIDLRIGASFTRFQTLLLKGLFAIPFAEAESKKNILSYGPCQFPTLGFVVERYWQIQSHVYEDFWTIVCKYYDEKDNINTEFTWIRGRLFDKIIAISIYEMCMETPIATVIDVNGQERRKFPPFPLNTVELQKRASKYLRMSSEHTMKIAEELYQSGYISYPRTETDFFQSSTNLKEIAAGQLQHPTWGAYVARLLDPEDSLWKFPGNGGHDDKAHPPIHPTKFTVRDNAWTNDHAKLYEFVVRHFLACVSQPAIGYESTAMIEIANEKFNAKGLMITARNYLDIYRYDSWGTKNIPAFQIGEKFMPTELFLRQGSTEPAPLLSEADLIGMMDKAGIGTDATIHDHIKKLLDREYAIKDHNTRFTPTPLGEALVLGYDAMGYELWKPHLRALMENDMKNVSQGIKTKEQVLNSTLSQTKACFVDAQLQKEKLIEAMSLFFERERNASIASGEIIRKCNLCFNNMVLRKKMDGNFMVGCSSYPECRNVIWLPNSILELNVLNEICQNCHPGPVKKILFKFRRSEIPSEFNSEHVGCIGGCDNILKQIIEACGTGSRTNQARGSRQTETSSFTPIPTGGSSRGTSQQDRGQSRGQSRGHAHNQNGTPSQSQTNEMRGRGRGRGRSRGQSQVQSQSRVRERGNDREGGANGVGRARGRSGTKRVKRGGTDAGPRFVDATGGSILVCFLCGNAGHFANQCTSIR